MEYKLEDLKFLNMKKEKIWVGNPRNRNGLHVFEIEKTLSENEKLEIIDQMKDGVGTYLFNILKKWESEKETLPKNDWGEPKTVSKKAWIKRNDPKGIIDIKFKLGKYWLFKNDYKEMSTICPETEYGYSMEYTGESVIHQWFHSLCEELYRNESNYFKENDPLQLKITKVKELGEHHRICFNNQDLNDIIWNGKTDVSEEMLDEFIKAYEILEKSIEDISINLNSKKVIN
jgi:hypothetical protein